MTNDPVIEAMLQSPAFFKRGGGESKVPHFYNATVAQVSLKGLWLDFGTGNGSALGHVLRATDKHVYGFDWFRGLPEEWVCSENERHPPGQWAAENPLRHIEGLEKRHEGRLTIINGLFQNTLIPFAREHGHEQIAFMQIDCDLYSSTRAIFDALGFMITRGTVMLFDEFWGYENYRDHEYKAFIEFVDKRKLGFEFIAHVADARQASIKIV